MRRKDREMDQDFAYSIIDQWIVNTNLDSFFKVM